MQILRTWMPCSKRLTYTENTDLRKPPRTFGTGVYQVSNWLTDNGNKVETKLYTGYRHEIHNYADLCDEVEDGIVDFMLRTIAG